jgi:hypothetical protein
VSLSWAERAIRNDKAFLAGEITADEYLAEDFRLDMDRPPLAGCLLAVSAILAAPILLVMWIFGG